MSAARSASMVSKEPLGASPVTTVSRWACHSAGCLKPGRTGLMARRPCWTALRLAMALPRSVRGPVDLRAFLRLAAIWRSVAIGADLQADRCETVLEMITREVAGAAHEMAARRSGAVLKLSQTEQP